MTSGRVIILLNQILLRPDLPSPLVMVGHTTRRVIVPSRIRNSMLIQTELAILPAQATEPKDHTEINQPHPCRNSPQNSTRSVKNVIVILAVLARCIPDSILVRWQTPPPPPRRCDHPFRRIETNMSSSRAIVRELEQIPRIPNPLTRRTLLSQHKRQRCTRHKQPTDQKTPKPMQIYPPPTIRLSPMVHKRPRRINKGHGPRDTRGKGFVGEVCVGPSSVGEEECGGDDDGG